MRKKQSSIRIKAKGKNQQLYLESLQKNKITFCEGPAGSGKTYLATLKGVEGLLNRQYEKLIISRPLVQSGEDSGYLPGGINDKLDPYVRPIYNILEHSFTNGDLDKLKEDKRIEVIPFGYMRGLNFWNSFIILDEVQNCSYEQLILALTRLAKGSTMVFTGDTTQSDLPKFKQGGFIELIKNLENLNNIGTVQLTQEDIVREPIIQKILEKLNEKKEKEI